jgi:hypothetical protein
VAGEWQIPGYRAIRDLGEGSAGRVVLAVHIATETPVAIKYLSQRLLADEDFLTRFRAEARLLAGLDDPNLVRFHEYVESIRRDAPPGSPPRGAGIVMELVDGVSLDRLIKTEGPTGPEAALTVLKGSLLGLAAAHSAGIVHRDYKPGNVLVSADGASKLADFGIAVRADEVGSGGVIISVPAAGTPAYMPPEQWSGRPVTPATDVYAAAAVFYECLTGERPFPGRTLPQLALAHRTAAVPVEKVPGPLRGLVAHGMAKTARDRPQSAMAFLEELETTALAAYGPAWEERGRNRLAELAALLALLFPLARHTAQDTTALAETELGVRDIGRRTARRFVIAAVAGAAVLLLGGTGVLVYAASSTGDDRGRPEAAAPGISISGSPSAAPSTDPSSDPSPDPATPTPTPTLTPTVTPPGEVTSAGGADGSGAPGGPPDINIPGGSPSPPSEDPEPATEITGMKASLTRDGKAGVATATVTVETNGTGQVSVSITFSNGQTDTQSDSGKRSYTFTSTSECETRSVEVVGQPGGATASATISPDEEQCEPPPEQIR